MAETLGSLIDKLTIKNLREYHLKEMIKRRDKKFTAAELKVKVALLEKQKAQLMDEVEAFVCAAAAGKIVLRDEKLKLYNPRAQMDRIPKMTRVAEAIAALSDKNSELWHLEDEARRTDVSLEFIGSVKRKIDLANQQRNDIIDRIDCLLEETLAAAKKAHGR